MQLPLSIIMDRALLICDMIAITKSFDLEMLLWNELQLYLEKSGWTELEFNHALLDYIDSNWINQTN